VPYSTAMERPYASHTFASKGHGVLLTSYLAPVKDMHTDNGSFDEVSSELCRHTPNPNALSTMCLLEISTNPQLITKFYGEPAKGIVTCQKMVFNQNAMMPGSTKKDKVQVHFCKMGGTPLVVPTDKDQNYTLVVRSKSVSHYVTRVGMIYKMMLHMEDCSVYSIYQTPAPNPRKTIDGIHKDIFVNRRFLDADVSQHIDTIKMTIGTVNADRYCEKFIVTMFFQTVPVSFQNSYQALKRSQGNKHHHVPRIACENGTILLEDNCNGPFCYKCLP